MSVRMVEVGRCKPCQLFKLSFSLLESTWLLQKLNQYITCSRIHRRKIQHDGLGNINGCSSKLSICWVVLVNVSFSIHTVSYSACKVDLKFNWCHFVCKIGKFLVVFKWINWLVFALQSSEEKWLFDDFKWNSS